MTKEEEKEYNREYYRKNKERILKQVKEYRELNKEKIAESKRDHYRSNIDEIRKKQHEYYLRNREHFINKQREYYESNKESVLKRIAETPMGRANNMITAYNQQDETQNRGRGDLDSRWVVENILSKPCAHCGKTGWNVIGCNRLDNSKPHTKDNVEPCCFECNIKLAVKDRQMRINASN